MEKKTKGIDRKNKEKGKSQVSSVWGGRFTGSPSDIMEKINPSIDFDKRFFAQDIEGSRVHAEMLGKQGIISANESKEIIEGLNQIEKEISEGNFQFRRDLEDIHMNVEARLTTLIGETGGRLHTARSRNDQVATDFKMWVRDKIDDLIKALSLLQKALINKAAE